MPDALLGLGSNVEAEANLPAAVELLATRIALRRVSSAWATPAVGPAGQPAFLNAAALVHTPLAPDELKRDVLRPIERSLGRSRSTDRFAPRTIDLDLVLYPVAALPDRVSAETPPAPPGSLVVDPDLVREAYLAVPAAELIPAWIHPGTGEPLARVAERLVASLPPERRPRRATLTLTR
jgi:2-amino-4-hydroxy-6-hydroxymethyldihydropteridine diphosphokinase